ncbi:MAG: hypothetical protein V4616_14630 [Bacteroidota bacterium]
MEKLISKLTVDNFKAPICLYGFDEEQETGEGLVFFPQGHIEGKCKKVDHLQRSLGLSLSGALSLMEVTPAEWGLMSGYFKSGGQ